MAFPLIRPPAESQAPSRGFASRAVTAFLPVVDDDAAVLRVTTRMLERIGHRFCTASGGREAVRVFEKRRDEIDAVMLDLTMPDWDGERVAREIRKTAPGVPILFMSGFSDHDASEHMRDAKGAAFLHKPFKSADVADAIAALLE